MTDWNEPGLTTEYSDFRDIFKDQLTKSVTMTDFDGDTNIPTGAVRRGTGDKLEKYNGSSWVTTDREAAIDAHINSAALHSGAPTGAIAAWLTGTPPTGWLLLQGQVVSRSTYAALFAVWGTTFGAGDGSTTFGLPDMRSRIPIGRGGSGSANVALGSLFGAIDHAHSGPSHTHAVAAHAHDMQNHTHTGGDHTHSTPDHTHTLPAHYHQVNANGADITVFSSGAHSHGIPTRNNATGFSNSGTSFGKIAPAWAGAYDVPTETSGGHVHATSDFAGRVGNVNSGNNGDGSMTSGTGGSGTTGTGGAVATGVPSNNNTSSVALTTDPGGTGNTGASNPPCIVVNWIVKAT